MTNRQKLRALIKKDGLNDSPEQNALREKINREGAKRLNRQMARKQLKDTGWLDKNGKW